MQEYDEVVLQYFLTHQDQLFDESVADTLVEAEAFLEDCLAVVVNSLKEVKEYFDEEGIDTSEMSLDELEEASEVFKIPDGRYLIVEG